LSVIYVPAGKAQQVSLDVMCKHPEVLRVWLRGIDMLIEDARGAGKVLIDVLPCPAHEQYSDHCMR